MTEPSTHPRTHRTTRIAIYVALAVIAVAAVVLALLGPTETRELADGAAEVGDAAFYRVPEDLPAGPPGSVVRTEQLASAPDGANAWRVLYRTTDDAGKVLVTSGVVVAPAATAPAGSRAVVGWGHPTTGAVARCAPSNGVDPYVLMEGLTDLLDAGFVVAAPDYPGLGVEGPSSYLIGSTEGNSVLDSVRAAQQISQTGAGSDVLLWGHSQGGQAALFAAQQARSYAPELTVQAVAAAAPAAELAALLNDDIGDVSGVTIGAYAFDAYVQAYADRYPGLTLTSILTDAGAAATPTMAQLCLIGQNAELHKLAEPLIGNYLRSDPGTTQPWADMLAENTPGAAPLGIPVFLAQGADDTLVRPPTTEQYATDLCGAGERVTLHVYPNTTHGTVADVAMPDVMNFLVAAKSGTPVPSTC